MSDTDMRITFISVLGDDLTVVNAARVSMHKTSNILDEKDNKLIEYLAKHNHWSPFSHPVLQYRVIAPIFIARQWWRHIVGIARNEVSRRYVDSEPRFYTPSTWRKRAAHVKQGSAENVDDETQRRMDEIYSALTDEALKTYRELLRHGVCPEQARMALPQSMLTEWIETASLYACLRIVAQRSDSHAQVEIQMLSKQLADIVKEHFPVSYAAFHTINQ